MRHQIGGHGGIAYDRKRAAPAPPFTLERSHALIALGLLASTAFAILLGPTPTFSS